MSGDIWLGDAARALAALTHDDRTERAVLRLLGLTPDTRTKPVHGGQSESGARVSSPSVDAAPSPEPGLPAPAVDEPAATAAPVEVPDGLPLLTPIGFEPPRPLPAPAQPLPRVDQSRLRVARPHEPLLAPRSALAVLGLALSRPAPEGEIDSDAFVQAISRAQPVDNLPRRLTRTLRFGVQVLVDLGAGMLPFARDQHDLVARVRSLFGPERTDVQRFADAPLRGTGPGARWTWKPYQPPPPDTRILLLSNFGIGGHPLDYLAGDRTEWQEFLDVVARHKATPVGFVPYPPQRWPLWLRSQLTLVCWDRGTTVSTIRSRVR